MADFQKSTYELAQVLGNKRKNAHKRRFTLNGDPSEIRTRVTAVKGRCPRPLDDRVNRTMVFIISEKIFFCKNFFMYSDFLRLQIVFLYVKLFLNGLASVQRVQNLIPKTLK